MEIVTEYEKDFKHMEQYIHEEKYDLRKNGVHAAVVDKLIKGGTIDTTIDKLCALLGCQPGDIMEYVPNKKDSGD